MYQLDGKTVEYRKCMDAVLDSLHTDFPVYYAFHHGIDIYWVEDHAPYWADEVILTKNGLELVGKDKVIEEFKLVR